MDFKKWVKSIQTAGYNGTHTVLQKLLKCIHYTKFAACNIALNIGNTQSENQLKSIAKNTTQKDRDAPFCK